LRKTFSDCLVAIAKNDSRVLLLTGDHGYSLFDKFRNECPDQYINAGIAEQNMVGMAAGLARTGFKPFVYGLSAFIPVRVIEQIKLDVAHDELPVVLIGDGAGFVYSHLGTSHQSTEDVACVRSIPNIDIYSPADRFELKLCMESSYQSNRPTYLRLCKSDLGDVHKNMPSSVETFLPIVISAEGFVSLVATGSMVKTAMEICAEDHRISSVISAPCLKPCNGRDLIDLVPRNTELIVVLEEHSIFGGLGSIVCEFYSEVNLGKVLRVGVNDRFSKYCGSYEYLRREHGLDKLSVQKLIDDFIFKSRE
jgi:transketolase